MSMHAVRGATSRISMIRAGIDTHISASLRPGYRSNHNGVHVELHGAGWGRAAREAGVGLSDGVLEAHPVGTPGGRSIDDSTEQTRQPRLVLCRGGEDGDCAG